MNIRVMCFIGFGFFALSPLKAQVTAIPDPDFEQALIDLGIDSNTTPNGSILTAEIDTIQDLNVSGRNISDLTGIGAFSSLTNLNCSSNRIPDLDLSANTALTTLICSSNQLTSLDLTANPDITTLICSSNQLPDLDLSQNDALTLLDCSNNQLTALAPGLNRLLENLNCSANQLTDLNVSQNDSLTLLSCSNNQLTTLDVSQNDSLQSLICAANQLRSLDVRSSPGLTTLDFSHNLLESLDASNNTRLTSLNGSGNLLQYLSINNGNNDALSHFNATDNPFLSCIAVDNPAAASATWQKDNTAVYATACTPIQTLIPDQNFEQALIASGLDTGLPDGLIITDNISSLTALDVSGENIADLTGIEDFAALRDLNCSNNQITDLDLTENRALTNLNCSSNDLGSLNLKNNNNSMLTTFDSRGNASLLCIAIDEGFVPPAGWLKDGATTYNVNCRAGETFVPDDNFEQALIDLGRDSGPLDNYVRTDSIDAVTKLDISGRYISDLTGIADFAALDSLDCSNNLLASLDVSSNTMLGELKCFSNYLPALDVTSNTALASLLCGDNKLNALDVTQNTALEILIFDSNNLTAIDITANVDLTDLNCNSNKIGQAGLDLTNAAALETLFCSNNSLSTLDISQNPLLTELDCSSNLLTSLDLASNVAIQKINVSRNFLSTLDLNTNVDLDTLICSSNQLTSVSLASNPLLQMLRCDNNLIGSIDLTANGELHFLDVSANSLTALGISNNTELINLDCSDNQLTALDVTSNPDLAHLAFAQNELTAIDLSQNAGLLSLQGDENQLASLNTGANLSLLSLSVSGNQLTSLGLGLNTALIKLNCSANALTGLDLTGNTSLSELSCQENDITGLDLTLLPDLTSVNCASNALISLSLKNGNNDALSALNARGNPHLLCIEVDDPVNTGSEWFKDDAASYNSDCHYSETYIPDDNFEAALAVLTGEPDNNDDYILTSVISPLTSLDVGSSNIVNLTGIQDFTSLQSLDISNNMIDSVFLNNNQALTSFNGSSNRFESLDFSGNRLLEILDVSGNSLASIKVDSLLSLTSLSCSANAIAELMLNNNSSLTSVSCHTNHLTILSVKNGNNSSLVTFDATDNPMLTCIQVDDGSSVGGQWLKDDAAGYSEDCHYHETYVPDDAFEQALIDLGYDYTFDETPDDYVPTAKIDKLPALRISGKGIADLTGIEDFTALVRLECSSNQLTQLDVGNNAKLAFLDCSANQISQLDLSANAALNELNISNNLLTALSISQNPALSKLNCSSNQLIGLDLLLNTNLVKVDARNNLLVSVDANNGFNSILREFDLRNNPALTCILVDDETAARGYPQWSKDSSAQYRLVCDDDDNDGIEDEDDTCPATPFGHRVDLFGCSVFSLPADHFTILTTSESCRAGNNGKINIAAATNYPHLATLYGPIDTVEYAFFDKVEIRNVRAGTYELCMTVTNMPGYSQCFTLAITEPEDLKVIPVEGSGAGRVAYKLKGSTAFIIAFNGHVFETEEDFIEFTLEKGRNTITIGTGAECQGLFEEVIYLADGPLAFPNPFDSYIRLLPGVGGSGEVQVNIYGMTGRMVLAERHVPVHGKVEVDVSSLPAGLYMIEMSGDTYYHKIKAVKK